MWIKEFGEELQLPGVNLSMYQVFYTSYAQVGLIVAIINKQYIFFVCSFLKNLLFSENHLV